MSLQWRVVLIVMVLGCLAAGATLGAGVRAARASVRAETASAIRAAELALEAPGSYGALRQRFAALELRHVRVAVDREAISSPVRAQVAPAWFETLIGADDVRRIYMVHGHRLVVAAYPGDEIAEAWGELTGSLLIALAALVGMLAGVHLAVTRALAPLDRFSRALEVMAMELPGGVLPAARVPELEMIGRRIAALDSGLAAARRRNTELSRSLVELQDRERQELACDVHDELGPLLFAIGVDAHTLTRSADGQRVNPDLVVAHAAAITAHVGEVRALSRRILGRLRPMALDHLPLSAVLAGLFDDLRGRHPAVALDLALAGPLDALDDSVALAVYRVVQEATLNAMRHGEPSRLTATVVVQGGEICIRVEDDGCGIGPSVTTGFGTVGMRERVEALGGRIGLEAKATGGTRVEVVLPLTDASASEQMAA